MQANKNTDSAMGAMIGANMLGKLGLGGVGASNAGSGGNTGGY